MGVRLPASVTEGFVIQDRFCITKRLGAGGFGQVFKAEDMKYNNEVALKLSSIYNCQTLRHERKMYVKLWLKYIPIGIPRPIAYYESKGVAALAMPVLGESLRGVWKNTGAFSARSIGHIGVQMLNRLEFIHSHGIVHLDIKPENMVLGRWMDSKTVYLLDFGLAASYLDKSGEHKPFRKGVGYCGTKAFASVHRDAWEQVSPRDDLESLVYSLMMLYNSSLPWCWGDWAHSSNYPRRVEVDKIEYRRKLCAGAPAPLQEIWKIVTNMEYGAKPRYDRLRELFMEVASECTEDDGLTFNLQ